MQPVLSIEDITVNYGSHTALKNATLRIPEGSFTGVIGPNGAGKSTLLKAMLGLVKTSSGNVNYRGKPLAQQRGLVGYVPQHNSVYWDFPATAREIVAMGAVGDSDLKKRAARNTAVTAAIAKVAAQEFQNQQIGELSGGQKQRIFLARALVSNPPLLLLDEPLQGIDAIAGAQIIEVLRQSNQQQHTTIVMVHHDLASAADYFTHLALINKTVHTYDTAQNALTAATLEKVFGIPPQILYREQTRPQSQ
ncbi:metal ABC transporter ATP-binding protein [Canibacter sp. lx-45]|nr:metal ABC transporter ATP-binding protein [Canibacter zhuwentaonis]MBT1035302.1 metal ABC transporter ATP-binding protein [Canibacter zhuwentaonis]